MHDGRSLLPAPSARQKFLLSFAIPRVGWERKRGEPLKCETMIFIFGRAGGGVGDGEELGHLVVHQRKALNL